MAAVTRLFVLCIFAVAMMPLATFAEEASTKTDNSQEIADLRASLEAATSKAEGLEKSLTDAQNDAAQAKQRLAEQEQLVQQKTSELQAEQQKTTEALAENTKLTQELENLRNAASAGVQAAETCQREYHQLQEHHTAAWLPHWIDARTKSVVSGVTSAGGESLHTLQRGSSSIGQKLRGLVRPLTRFRIPGLATYLRKFAILKRRILRLPVISQVSRVFSRVFGGISLQLRIVFLELEGLVTRVFSRHAIVRPLSRKPVSSYVTAALLRKNI